MPLLFAEIVTVLTKYSDFANVFLEKSANILLKQTGVNKHVIKLEKSKQPPYKLIYSLGLVELKTFKSYIKTNLANSFIWASKLLASAPILFVCNYNSSLRLCVNYQGLNNLIIKN